MLISTITSNIPFIQLSLMHRITEKICKERWQHWCAKISGVKVLPTLLISTITSNMSFIQLSLMLSGYPASSFGYGLHARGFALWLQAAAGRRVASSFDLSWSEALDVQQILLATPGVHLLQGGAALVLTLACLSCLSLKFKKDRLALENSALWAAIYLSVRLNFF